MDYILIHLFCNIDSLEIVVQSSRIVEVLESHSARLEQIQRYYKRVPTGDEEANTGMPKERVEIMKNLPSRTHILLKGALHFTDRRRYR